MAARVLLHLATLLQLARQSLALLSFGGVAVPQKLAYVVAVFYLFGDDAAEILFPRHLIAVQEDVSGA